MYNYYLVHYSKAAFLKTKQNDLFGVLFIFIQNHREYNQHAVCLPLHPVSLSASC